MIVQRFWFKRLLIFKLIPRKIKLSNLESLSHNKKNVFIFLILNESVRENKYIRNFVKDKVDSTVILERSDFKEWFNKNKHQYQKYIFLNNNMHVKQEYRWIRNQNILAYLIY